MFLIVLVLFPATVPVRDSQSPPPKMIRRHSLSCETPTSHCGFFHVQDFILLWSTEPLNSAVGKPWEAQGRLWTVRDLIPWLPDIMALKMNVTCVRHLQTAWSAYICSMFLSIIHEADEIQYEPAEVFRSQIWNRQSPLKSWWPRPIALTHSSFLWRSLAHHQHIHWSHGASSKALWPRNYNWGRIPVTWTVITGWNSIGFNIFNESKYLHGKYRWYYHRFVSPLWPLSEDNLPAWRQCSSAWPQSFHLRCTAWWRDIS